MSQQRPLFEAFMREQPQTQGAPPLTSRAIAKLHYSNTFARTPDVNVLGGSAGGLIPRLARVESKA